LATRGAPLGYAYFTVLLWFLVDLERSKVKVTYANRETRENAEIGFCHNGAAYGATDQTVNSTTVTLLPLFRGRVILLFHALQICLFYVFIRFTFLIYLRQRRRYMFSPARPRSSVCLSVCVQDYSKTRVWIWIKCCMSTDVGTWTNTN